MSESAVSKNINRFLECKEACAYQGVEPSIDYHIRAGGIEVEAKWALPGGKVKVKVDFPNGVFAWGSVAEKVNGALKEHLESEIPGLYKS